MRRLTLIGSALLLALGLACMACSDDDTGTAPGGEVDAGGGADDTGAGGDTDPDSDTGPDALPDSGGDAATGGECGGCLIDSVCYPDGVFDPANVCALCDMTLSATGWSANDGQSCDDGLFCNGFDSCEGGACSAHEHEPCADDGFFCNGTETCSDEGDGCLHTGDPCTAPGELCIEADDQCCVPNVVASEPACNDDGDVTAFDSCGYQVVVDDCADAHGVCVDAACGCEDGWGGDGCGCLLFVDGQVSDSGDGASWDTAFKTVQEAVDAGAESPGGCAVWVKGLTDSGLTYPERIILYDDVLLFGGFAGSETSFGDRDADTNLTILDGGGAGTVVTYEGTSSAPNHALIDGFTITGGTLSGMRVENASPTVSNCRFVENSAPSGGGIYAGDSNLVLTDTAFERNATWNGATGTGGYNEQGHRDGLPGGDAGHGGALFIDGGSPVIAGCLFSHNTAGNGGDGGVGFEDGSGRDRHGAGGLGGDGGHGGGIYLADGTIRVNDCEFIGNAAGAGGTTGQGFDEDDGREGGAGGSGGAIHIAGGALALADTPITSNYAGRGGNGGTNRDREGGPGGDAGHGGGIFVAAGASTLSGSVFSGNVAGPGGDGGGGDNRSGVGGDGGDGGGAFLAGQSATITDCDFIENVAGAGGPWDDRAEDGGDAGRGGGLYLSATSNVVQRCSISKNAAGNGGEETGDGDGGDGGHGGGVFVAGGTTSLVDCAVTENAAGDGGRGDDTHGYAGNGGGLYLDDGAVTLVGCTISDNVAGAGPERGEGGRDGGDGGGVYIHRAVAALWGCTIAGNAAGPGGVGGRGGGGDGGRGGGLFIEHDGTSLVGCLVADNRAGSAGDGDWGGDAGLGGGIYFYGGDTELLNCTVVGNRAGEAGAGDTSEEDGDLGEGGGLYNDSSAVTVTNAIVWGNHASGNGPQVATRLGGSPSYTLTYTAVQARVFAGDGNTDADPLFEDAAGGNYHLQQDSPCVDKGHTESLPLDGPDLDGDGQTDEPLPVDLAGDRRVVGEHVDMGAFEYFPGCNNYVVDEGEECEDGNTDDGDGCSSTCSCERIGTSAMCPAPSCEALHESLSHDDIYWIVPPEEGDPYMAWCDMTTHGGGWTMVLRLNSNDGGIRWYGATDFWESQAEFGELDAETDYLSPAYYTLADWDQILVDYRYAEGQAKRMAAVFQGENNDLFRDHAALLPESNENPPWQRTHTVSEGENANADTWYGEALRFRTIGNGADDAHGNDSYRIWYNRVPVDACNQAGGIGGQVDGGTWYHELSFPSDTGGCQENTHRGWIGSDAGRRDVADWMGEQLLSPVDAYDHGIMTVYVR